MTIGKAFAAELALEVLTTRRVLERVPEGDLAWRPHERSMSLGQLALHVATLPSQLVGFVSADDVDVDGVDFTPPSPSGRDAVIEALDVSLRDGAAYFAALPDHRAASPWSLTRGNQVLFSAPRAGVLRSFLFNHWYHHRGQLLVYLRLLDVPVPWVYGPTADENPFGN
jgi:uncharacterized damage-inducible protein DinB